jgi:hypothetical protein
LARILNQENLTLRYVGAEHSWGPLFADDGDICDLESDYLDNPNDTNLKIRLRKEGEKNLVDVMTGVATGDFMKFQLENKINLPCNVILDVLQIVSVVASGCHGVG